MSKTGVVAVTGASGFIGSALCQYLSERGFDVRAIVRHADPGSHAIANGDIGPDTDWSSALDGVDCVVHCAGRAHILNDTTENPLQEFRRVNRDGTIQLARHAVSAGVRRFVFLSSVGVVGAPSRNGEIYDIETIPQPDWDYAVSKWEAEQALNGLADETGLQVTNVRPPMVYGPGVPANFRRLLKLVDLGVPLPFGAIDNRRSMVALANLLSFLEECIVNPEAAGKTFFVSDNHDLSTPELTRLIATALGRRPLLVPVPTFVLWFLGKLIGRTQDIERLTGNLQIDTTYSCSTLGWKPPLSVENAIFQTVKWYKTL
ncbi:UDP-glucose 4-epimerase family protein [Sulfitobacter faviae]|uniref:UDP-glucose 4-epimerase family protein n=1 Tax=Sulfitobacter faviae TaxID=1775881 RepID=UPI00398D4DB3